MIRYYGMGFRLSFFAALLLAGRPAAAQVPSLSSPGQHAVFVFLQRTGGHVKFSTSEVFQKVVADVFAHLNSVNVSMATDSFGGRRSSEDEMPLETVQKIARDAGADSLLHVVVDRPFTKWLSIVASCYDSSGNLLWAEEAASGGGITGGHGLQVTLERLHQRLDKHLGHQGLPLKANSAQTFKSRMQILPAASPLN